MFPMSDKDGGPNILQRLGEWYVRWLKRPPMVPTTGTAITREATAADVAAVEGRFIEVGPKGVMGQGRYYGSGGTIHQTGEVNVELFEGRVVSVWFRCATLPFTQTEVAERRVLDMVSGYAEYPPARIEGIVFEK